MATLISGSTGVDKIQDGTIVNADIASGAAIAGSKLVMPTGSVIQTIQSGSTSTTTFTVTNTWNSHISATITPSSTSSKILVFATQPVHLGGTAFLRGGIRVLRGSTAIWNTIGNKELFHVRNAEGEFDVVQTLQYLDSPATTSATIYMMQGALQTGSTMSMWDSGRGTNITLMEIAG